MRLLRKSLATVVALLAIALALRLVSFYSYYAPQIRLLPDRINASLQQAGALYTPIDRVPAFFISALTSTEDRRFYSHHGVDTRGLLRAILTNLRQERLAEGGSTITQQLARGQFLTRRKSIQRKLKEMLLALAIERAFTKDEILEFYVNQSYFGHGATGIGSGSLVFFHKPPIALTLPEAAALAGLLRGPSLYDPFVNPELTKRRQGEVLRNMVDVNYLAPEEANDAFLTTLPLIGPGRELGLR